ncbi:MAG: tetratricopeptide repeat protein, partial [Alkalispirochaetaceae bacterium]
VAGFRWLGTLEELVGNYQGALDAFEALLELEPEDDRIRLRAAAAALETGDYRRARGHAQFVIDSARNREAQREAGLYLALSHFFRGEREAGLSLFRSLTRGNSRRTVESRTLLYALLAARFWEERSYAAELEGKLDALYQVSLDTLAVKGDGAITLAPRPSLILPEGAFGRMDDLLPELVEAPLAEEPLPEAPGNRASDSDDSGDSEVPEAEEQEQAEEQAEVALVIGIQTGSFSDRGNAVVMREEIRESGLAAEVRSVDVDGRIFYRVVVPTEEPTPAEDVQTLVVRLKELGVEGFLLFEE